MLKFYVLYKTTKQDLFKMTVIVKPNELVKRDYLILDF